VEIIIRIFMRPDIYQTDIPFFFKRAKATKTFEYKIFVEKKSFEYSE